MTLVGENEPNNLAERKLCPCDPRSNTTESGHCGFGGGADPLNLEMRCPVIRYGLSSGPGISELCFSRLGSRTSPCKNNAHEILTVSAKPMLELSQKSWSEGVGC